LLLSLQLRQRPMLMEPAFRWMVAEPVVYKRNNN
jgi:hypothetical protein